MIRTDALPFIGVSGFPLDRPLLELSLQIAMTEPSKKESMDRRLKNAIHLLAESDQQSNASVGLALCMAGIESLICERNPGIVKTLIERGALLLEPDRKQWPQVKQFLTTLYDRRSDIMHGSRIESSNIDRCAARLVAAGLVQAMLQRRSFFKKLWDEMESPDAFFKELDDTALIGGSSVVGVSPPSLSVLWRSPNIFDVFRQSGWTF